MVIMMLAGFLAQPFTTLLPIFAKDILQVGSPGQGLLLTSMGIGALLSAVMIASLGDRLPKGVLMASGAAGYGTVLVGFAASRWFPASMLLMVLIGLANVFCNALVQTVVQAHSPPEIRGRVMGVFQQREVLNTAGSMLIGAIAAAWGAPSAVALMGAACALGAVAVYVLIPHVRTIR
jgi:MFS family permease